MFKPQQQSFRDWLIGLLHAVEQGPPAPDSAEVFADTILEALAKRLERVVPEKQDTGGWTVQPGSKGAWKSGYNQALKDYEAAIRKELE